MILSINAAHVSYQLGEFKKWPRNVVDSPLYVGNFSDYGEMNGLRVKVKTEILKSQVLPDDLNNKNLCYLLVLNSKTAYIKFPNRRGKITKSFLMKIGLIFTADMLSVADYLIKSIIE
jgi:hypothetical protein